MLAWCVLLDSPFSQQPNLQLEERKLDLDVDLLQANILEALELGLDDESEAYNEAGMLLDELTGGTAFSSTSTTPTASPHHRSSSSNNRYPRGFGTPRSSKLTPKFSFETVHEHFPATFGGGIAESGNDDDDHDGSDDDGDKAEDIAYDEAVREVEEV